MLKNSIKNEKPLKMKRKMKKCEIKVSPLKSLLHETNNVGTRKALSKITRKKMHFALKSRPYNNE